MPQTLREVFRDEIHMESLPVAVGGFSDIHLARWANTEINGNQKLAIKTFRGTHLYDEENQATIQRRLRTEIQTWQRAQSHPNILPFIGTCRVSEVAVPSLVSPYRPNGNILDYLKRHPYANRHELAIGVIKGIVHLHSYGIVHGDLTPKNILIHKKNDESVVPEISDFGRAKILDVQGFTGSLQTSCRYTAPEVLLETHLLESVAGGVPKPGNKLLTRQSDVYSLGMVILEILSGVPPFSTRTDVQVSWVLGQGGTPSINEHEIYHPMNWVWSLLQGCWKFGDRPVSRCSASQCLKHLQELTPSSTLN